MRATGGIKTRPRVMVLDPNRRLSAKYAASLSEVRRGRPRTYPKIRPGDRFGKWVVIGFWLPSLKNPSHKQVCVKCVCGNWKVHDEWTLLRGDSLSCGCAQLNHLWHKGVLRRFEPKKVRKKILKVLTEVQAITINTRRGR